MFYIKTSILPVFLLLILQVGFTQEANKAVPVFRDGEAQVVEAFSNQEDWIIQELWVETDFDSDGNGLRDRIHTSVIRPGQTETEGLKLPVILVMSPYFGGMATSHDFFWDVRHELGEQPPYREHPQPIITRDRRPVISKRGAGTWIPRGYIMAYASSPGTGFSQGAPTIGGKNESLAPKAVIDWLCGRADGFTSPFGNEKVNAYWSTGKIGMTGGSYNGTLCIAAATTGVEGLEAIIPIAPNTSYYHYYRSNGLVRSPGGYLGEDADVLYDAINSGPVENRPYNDSIVRDGIIAQGIDRITGDYNDFWAERDYLNHMEKFKTALFMAHGFNDWNVMPEHSFRIYQAAKDKGLPVMLYFHQDGHGGNPPLSLMNRWFTRYLHGVENGVENDSPVWITRENNNRKAPTPYKNYPHPDAQSIRLHLGPGAPGIGSLQLKNPLSTETEFLVDDFHYSGRALAQKDTSYNRLLYVTHILKDTLHISGVPEITVRLSSTKPAANLSVWLVALPWEEGGHITENIITRGWADPQNADSVWKSKPLKRGEYVEFTFPLQPDDQVIPPGQQIGLMIFSTDREFTLWPFPGTKLMVDLEKTYLKLPIVGGKSAWVEAIGN